MDDDLDFDELEPTYEEFGHRRRVLGFVLPVVALLVVIAIVSGLVFGGVIQGHQSRTGPSEPATTQPTVIISP